jgi:hypothetical protein
MDVHANRGNLIFSSTLVGKRKRKRKLVTGQQQNNESNTHLEFI